MFRDTAFPRLPAGAQHYGRAEIRDKTGKGFYWAKLGSFIHVQHDSERCLVPVGGRKLGGEWRGRLVGAAGRWHCLWGGLLDVLWWSPGLQAGLKHGLCLPCGTQQQDRGNVASFPTS